ncbi:MAG: HAD-IIIA family hydrolase [Deltaproteobacteria bacterium]|nr:HAD-IIIA family hydrolase [Deltaproteobacteria bacterium]
MAYIDKELLMTKARNIRLLALDVDGVLTDGSIVYTSQGEQVQSFHVHDGLGLKLLGLAEIHVAILSSRSSRALAIRAEELGIKLVYQGLPDKIEVYEEIKEKLGIEDKEVAYIGDDWVDLPLLQKAGLAIVVANATQSMKDYADYVTQKTGGRGAVREVCELILKSQNMRNKFLNHYLNK